MKDYGWAVGSRRSARPTPRRGYLNFYGKRLIPNLSPNKSWQAWLPEEWRVLSLSRLLRRETIRSAEMSFSHVEETLAPLWSGEPLWSLRDHRASELLRLHPRYKLHAGRYFTLSLAARRAIVPRCWENAIARLRVKPVGSKESTTSPWQGNRCRVFLVGTCNEEQRAADISQANRWTKIDPQVIGALEILAPLSFSLPVDLALAVFLSNYDVRDLPTNCLLWTESCEWDYWWAIN